jgi:hypothetical protein
LELVVAGQVELLVVPYLAISSQRPLMPKGRLRTGFVVVNTPGCCDRSHFSTGNIAWMMTMFSMFVGHRGWGTLRASSNSGACFFMAAVTANPPDITLPRFVARNTGV